MSHSVNDGTDVKRFLEIGMRLSVVFQFGPNDQYSTQCSFIGMKDNQFLIFELGAKTMEDLITRRTNNAYVVLKGIADTEYGHIFAFQSQVIGIKNLVSWLMFVRFPRSVETKVIRKDRRYKVDLKTEVTYQEQKLTTMIQDLSVSGCGLYFDQHVEMESGDEVTIASPLDFIPEPYPKCIVANCRRDGSGTAVGINFDRPIKVNDKLRLEIFKHLQAQGEL